MCSAEKTQKLIVALLLLCVFTIPSIARGQSIIVEAYLDSAQSALDASDTKKAARLFALALTDAQEQNKPALVARALIGAASVHIRMSQFAEATANARAALGIYEQLPDSEPMAVIAGLNSLALVHYHQNHYELAEALYEKVIPMLQAQDGDHELALAAVLNDLAVVEIALKNPEAAERLATEAAEVMKERFGSRSAKFAVCLDTVALRCTPVANMTRPNSSPSRHWKSATRSLAPSTPNTVRTLLHSE